MFVLREAELDALMGRLAMGDRAAFEPLYRALRPRAEAFLRRRVGDLADDVAQVALMKIFARASEFIPGRPCLPWFYAVLANEVRSARRHASRGSAVALPEDLRSEEISAEDAFIARECQRALELALESLDPDAAGAIHAVLGRGPLPPVAAATYRKRLSRAYAKLRVLLGASDGS